MESLTLARCSNHREREAVARCPRCRRFFCRECITEHEGRVLCAGCLRELAAAGGSAGRRAPLRVVAGVVLGVLLAWAFFLLAGRILINVPTAFHEGTIWPGGGEGT